MTRQELNQKYPEVSFGHVHVKRAFDFPYTGRMDKYGQEERDTSENAQIIDKGWEIYLKHSCDEWVIGSVEEAEEFATELQQILEYCRNNP